MGLKKLILRRNVAKCGKIFGEKEKVYFLCIALSYYSFIKTYYYVRN